MAGEIYIYDTIWSINISNGVISGGTPVAGAGNGYLETAIDFGSSVFTPGEGVFIFDGDGDFDTQLIFHGYVGSGPEAGVILYLGPPSSPTYFLYTFRSYNDGDTLTVTSSPTDEPFCLAHGTFVDVPGGRVRVEDLRPGDVVMTSEGDESIIRWIGRQTHRPSTGARDTRPIVVRAGAIDAAVPDADLTVSADHGILIDDVLVNARALVNGSSVVFADLAAGETVDYFHLELDDHRTVLANGAPVESFVDNVSRQGFDNYDEWVALGLEPLPANPTPFLRAKSARQVPQRVRDRMAMRMEELGIVGDALAV